MATCPCDSRDFPPILDIPAGLDRLNRQIAGFPDFRQALLAGIAPQAGARRLAGSRRRRFRADGPGMVGLCARRARLLLGRNQRRALPSDGAPGRRRCAAWPRSSAIRPRPRLRRRRPWPLFAEPGQPVVVPVGTAFRSDAFDGQPPQVFEADRKRGSTPASTNGRSPPSAGPHSTTVRSSSTCAAPASARASWC